MRTTLPARVVHSAFGSTVRKGTRSIGPAGGWFLGNKTELTTQLPDGSIGVIGAGASSRVGAVAIAKTGSPPPSPSAASTKPATTSPAADIQVEPASPGDNIFVVGAGAPVESPQARGRAPSPSPLNAWKLDDLAQQRSEFAPQPPDAMEAAQRLLATRGGTSYANTATRASTARSRGQRLRPTTPAERAMRRSLNASATSVGKSLLGNATVPQVSQSAHLLTRNTHALPRNSH